MSLRFAGSPAALAAAAAVAVVVVVAGVGGAVVVAGSGADPGAAPPDGAPPVVEPAAPAEPVDDGRHHLVVTPREAPAPEPQPAPGPEPGPAPAPSTTAPLGAVPGPPATSPPPSGPVGVGSGAGAWELGPGLLASLPTGVRLVLDGGTLAAELPDGRVVALDDLVTDGVPEPVPPPPVPTTAALPATTTTTSPPAPAVHGNPVIDELATRPGVEDVQAVGDGSFAVSLSDLAVLEDLALDVAPDAPLLPAARDPLRDDQWALANTGRNLSHLSPRPVQQAGADVDAAGAWLRASGGGVVVAVIDGGIDGDHPDLAHARWTNPDETCDDGVDQDGNGLVDDCHGWDFGAGRPGTGDGGGLHATHLAGVIAAGRDDGIGVTGLAPDARIMDLAVGRVGEDGRAVVRSSEVARAVRYAVDQGAQVITISLTTPPGTPRRDVAALEAAIGHAADQGVLVVAAAGNDGVSLDEVAVWPAAFEHPNLVTVGSSTPADTPAPASNSGLAVDLLAPGELITSTAPDGGYAVMSGTSQAAALTAAAAALVLGQDPSLDPAAVIERLVTTVEGREALVPASRSGGRLDAGRAVDAGP